MNNPINARHMERSQVETSWTKSPAINIDAYLVAKLVVGGILLSLGVGCASLGGQSEPPLTTVQTVQIGDDALDCPALQKQIFDAEAVVSKLTQQIESDKSAARMSDTASAINSYLGQSNIFNSLMSTSARSSAEDLREVRDSYQKRRDILLQAYMAKKCSVPRSAELKS